MVKTTTTKRTAKGSSKSKASAKGKAKAKGTKAAKGAKKAAPKAKAEVNGEYGVERSRDLPWGDKKVAVFRALKALRATKAANARTAKEVAAKAKVTARDVRHYCYHAKAVGLTDVVEMEEGRGYGFHLTAKGAEIDPVKVRKAQDDAKG